MEQRRTKKKSGGEDDDEGMFLKSKGEMIGYTK